MSALIEPADARPYSPDDALIADLRAHDEGGFATIVGRYERELLRFC